MGYSTRPGTEIRDFWPDDTDMVMYIETGYSSTNLDELIEKINEKWPDSKLSEFEITSEYIHTSCLGYDLYDSSDYTHFIVITKAE